jgi:hypothetical protein
MYDLEMLRRVKGASKSSLDLQLVVVLRAITSSGLHGLREAHLQECVWVYALTPRSYRHQMIS